jgi:DNA polymerase-3 subunit epsilon
MADDSFKTFKVRPEHIETADPKALEVNGFRPEDWEDAISQRSAAAHLSAMLRGSILVGHGVRLDLNFLDALSQQQGVEISTRYAIDTVTLVEEHLRPLGLKSRSLKNTCTFLGIPPEPDVHRALNGARLAKRVFEKLARAGPLDRLWWWARNVRKG